MDNYLKELASLLKFHNDSKVQLKALTLLRDILESLRKLEKKKLTECQSQIEESLLNYISNSRANSDICNRYIYYLYKHIFDNGLSSRINEFISKFSSLLSSKDSTTNVKANALWILGKVCSKSNFKSGQLSDLIYQLVKIIKNTRELLIKNESFATLNRLLKLKLPSLIDQIPEVLKITLKQEKSFSNEGKCKKNILKTLDAVVFYLNTNMIVRDYKEILDLLTRGLDDDDEEIRNLSVCLYTNIHIDKLFDQEINLQNIRRKNYNVHPSNFLEVLLSFGVQLSGKLDMNLNLKMSYITIIKILFSKNKEFINKSENLIPKIFDLLLKDFPLNYSGFISNNTLNYNKNLLTSFTSKGSSVVTGSTSSTSSTTNTLPIPIPSTILNQNKLNTCIEELYRTYIQAIYTSSYRKVLLHHIFKRLHNSQADLDKIENISLSVTASPSPRKGKKGEPEKEPEKEKERIKYTEFQVNAMLLSLIEFSENNFDIFEVSYKSFPDISQNLMVYLISSVKSFRMLMNRVLINLSYFIPSWRIPILTLILNLGSVAHAEVASLRNTFIYFIDENVPEYKYSLIIRNNLDLLKDISNCLGIVLCTFAHKTHGVTVDMSNAALVIAKNMIIGKFADEEDNPKSLSLKDKTSRFNYSNSDADVHKEAGWIIIQGLCSMDYTWLTNNFKSFFLLWKYIFSEHCCEVDEKELNQPEYREALVSEFFIKKAALASLRKFVLAAGDFANAQSFQLLVPKFLFAALQFFIPFEKPSVINFYKCVLKEKYKEAKYFLYNCFLAIPIKTYAYKYNLLLYPLTDDITSNEYTEYTYEHIYANLNQKDTFMCEKVHQRPNAISNVNYNSSNVFLIDNFCIEKCSLFLTDRTNLDTNAKLVNSATNLLVEIILDSNLNIKNRQVIFKHLLSNMTVMSMKQFNISDVGVFNKTINIAYTLLMILKKSFHRGVYIINDESSFTNSKMILDFGFKLDSNLLRRISAEGHSYLIRVSPNPKSNIEYYLTASECKFKNDSNLDNIDFISTFYLFANIFRYNEFSDILPFLDNYMNFIISYFNKIEDLYSPLISQSIYIITEVLLKNDQVDHARKLIEIFKMNYLFINHDNSIFFKDIFERNSLTEIRLMLILLELKDNIKQTDYDLLKLLLNKYLLDEKYKSKKVKKAFLYFSKKIMQSHYKLKELVYNPQFINFLFDNITQETEEDVSSSSCNSLNMNISNNSLDVLSNNLDMKFSLEILIAIFLTDTKYFEGNSNIINTKDFIEKLVNILNNLYNNNRGFYFNHHVLKSQVMKIPSCKNSSDFLFDKNSNKNITNICKFIDVNGTNFEQVNCLYFNMAYMDYNLIKLCKILLRIYFEKKFNQVIPILNLMKELIQSQLSLYSSGQVKSSMKESKSDSLTRNEDIKDQGVNALNKPLLSIRKMKRYMHIQLKKFLIKSLKLCLLQTLSNLSSGLIKASSTSSNTLLLDFLNNFMNSSMVLVSCEESWEIKIKGVELLIQIIGKFANIIDTRTDDNSLLIQQYEAQISSCIKIIFNNSFSIDSLFKGLKLLYQYIAVPISTDPNYCKKVNTFVDMNLKSEIMAINSFSERYDHLLTCKKMNFFCKLYLTAFSPKIKHLPLYNVFNSEIENIAIYHEFLPNNFKDNIAEFFNANFVQFFLNLYHMLKDFYIVLTFDKKFAKNYKGYQFLISGNRISYSHHKILKYCQLYLKLFSLVVNDTKNLSGPVKTQIEEILIKSSCESEENGTSLQCGIFDMIFYVIIYYINHFTLKKLNNAEGGDYIANTNFVIFTEDDINDEIREKVVLNCLNTVEMVDVMSNVLMNSTDVISMGKTTFFDILRISVNLSILSIEEVDAKVMTVIDLLVNKWLRELEKKIALTVEEKRQVIANVAKFVYFYFTNRYSNCNNTAATLIPTIIDIIHGILDYIISNHEAFPFTTNEDMYEYFSHLFSILIKIFLQFNQHSKQSAAKLFSTLTLIEDINAHALTPIFEILSNTLNDLLSQFDKFFLLFYMVLQYISKKSTVTKCELCLHEAYHFAVNEIFIQHIHNKEYTTLVFKSLMIGLSQNFDSCMKNVIELILIYLIQKDYLIPYFTLSDDLQNIILTFVLTIEDEQKRRMMIKIILYTLIDISNTYDIMKLSLFVMKLASKDLEFFKEISSEMDRNLVTNVEHLFMLQAQYNAQQQLAIEEKRIISSQKVETVKSEEKQIERNDMTSSANNHSNVNVNVNMTSNSGPKLKAIKFKK